MRSCAGFDECDFAAVAAATVGFPPRCFAAPARGAAARIGSLPYWCSPPGAQPTSALARDAAPTVRRALVRRRSRRQASNYATTVAPLIGGFQHSYCSPPRPPPDVAVDALYHIDGAAPRRDRGGPPEPFLQRRPTPSWTAAPRRVALLLLLTAVLPNSWQGFTAAGIVDIDGRAPVRWWTSVPRWPEGESLFDTGFFEFSEIDLKATPDVALYYAFLMVLALMACAGPSPRGRGSSGGGCVPSPSARASPWAFFGSWSPRALRFVDHQRQDPSRRGGRSSRAQASARTSVWLCYYCPWRGDL